MTAEEQRGFVRILVNDKSLRPMIAIQFIGVDLKALRECYEFGLVFQSLDRGLRLRLAEIRPDQEFGILMLCAFLDEPKQMDNVVHIIACRSVLHELEAK